MAKVLIVEDQFLVAAELEDFIGDAGHDVTGLASTAAMALEVAERDPPEIAVVDIKLAEDFDGVQVACLIAARFASRIVLVTGYGDEVIAAARSQVEPCFVLRKPYTREDVAAALAECVPNIVRR